MAAASRLRLPPWARARTARPHRGPPDRRRTGGRSHGDIEGMAMHLAHYLGLLHKAEDSLAAAFRDVGDAHADEPDVFRDCDRMSRQCASHVNTLRPFVDHYGEDAPDEPDQLHSTLFQGTRSGGLGLTAGPARPP